MQSSASGLAARPEASYRTATLSIRSNATHVIVLRWTHRDRLARWIDAGPKARRGDSRKARLEIRADCRARVEKHMPAVGALTPDCARDNIARRKFGSRRSCHESVTGIVDQNRAFAAQGFADERHRPRCDVERGWMELSEFHVCEKGASARSKRHALPEAAKGIGALLKEPTNSAGRDHDPSGRKQRGAGGADRENATNRIVLDNNPSRLESLENFNRWRRSRGYDEGAHQLAPCAIAAYVNDAWATVRGLEPEREAPVLRPIKANGEAGELLDRHRRGTCEAIDDRRVAESIARGYRVGGMQSGTVTLADSRSHPALRPERRALGPKRRLRE